MKDTTTIISTVFTTTRMQSNILSLTKNLPVRNVYRPSYVRTKTTISETGRALSVYSIIRLPGITALSVLDNRGTTAAGSTETHVRPLDAVCKQSALVVVV